MMWNIYYQLHAPAAPVSVYRGLLKIPSGCPHVSLAVPREIPIRAPAPEQNKLQWKPFLCFKLNLYFRP